MLESKPFSHPQSHGLRSNPSLSTNRRSQQRRMTMALMLLLFALALVLFRDRDFWFPDDVQVQDDTERASLSATAKNVQRRHSRSKARGRGPIRLESVVDSLEVADRGPSVATTRMVSPLMEVEVLAADSHRKLRLGSNTVQVNLERASSLSRAKPGVVVDPNPSRLP
jgi:hypothetical protein